MIECRKGDLFASTEYSLQQDCAVIVEIEPIFCEKQGGCRTGNTGDSDVDFGKRLKGLWSVIGNILLWIGGIEVGGVVWECEGDGWEWVTSHFCDWRRCGIGRWRERGGSSEVAEVGLEGGCGWMSICALQNGCDCAVKGLMTFIFWLLETLEVLMFHSVVKFWTESGSQSIRTSKEDGNNVHKYTLGDLARKWWGESTTLLMKLRIVQLLPSFCQFLVKKINCNLLGFPSKYFTRL